MGAAWLTSGPTIEVMMKRLLTATALLPLSTGVMAHAGPLHSHGAFPLGVAIIATLLTAGLVMVWRRR